MPPQRGTFITLAFPPRKSVRPIARSSNPPRWSSDRFGPRARVIGPPCEPLGLAPARRAGVGCRLLGALPPQPNKHPEPPARKPNTARRTTAFEIRFIRADLRCVAAPAQASEWRGQTSKQWGLQRHRRCARGDSLRRQLHHAAGTRVDGVVVPSSRVLVASTAMPDGKSSPEARVTGIPPSARDLHDCLPVRPIDARRVHRDTSESHPLPKRVRRGLRRRLGPSLPRGHRR